MKRQWDLSGWRWMKRKRERLTEWGEEGSTAEGANAISHWNILCAINSKEHITVLGCQTEMDDQDTCSVRCPPCVPVCVCATEDGINKNWILIWNLTNTKSKGLILASLERAGLPLLHTETHTHQGHQVISTISRVVSYSWFKIKKSLKGMKVPPGEARVA